MFSLSRSQYRDTLFLSDPLSNLYSSFVRDWQRCAAFLALSLTLVPSFRYHKVITMDTTWSCPLCPSVKSDEPALLDHVRRVHNTAPHYLSRIYPSWASRGSTPDPEYVELSDDELNPEYPTPSSVPVPDQYIPVEEPSSMEQPTPDEEHSPMEQESNNNDEEALDGYCLVSKTVDSLDEFKTRMQEEKTKFLVSPALKSTEGFRDLVQGMVSEGEMLYHDVQNETEDTAELTDSEGTPPLIVVEPGPPSSPIPEKNVSPIPEENVSPIPEENVSPITGVEAQTVPVQEENPTDALMRSPSPVTTDAPQIYPTSPLEQPDPVYISAAEASDPECYAYRLADAQYEAVNNSRPEPDFLTVTEDGLPPAPYSSQDNPAPGSPSHEASIRPSPDLAEQEAPVEPSPEMSQDEDPTSSGPHPGEVPESPAKDEEIGLDSLPGSSRESPIFEVSDRERFDISDSEEEDSSSSSEAQSQEISDFEDSDKEMQDSSDSEEDDEPPRPPRVYNRKNPVPKASNREDPAPKVIRIRRPTPPSVICSQCNKKFANKASLRVHVTNMHSKTWDPCPDCGKRFPSARLGHHRATVHGGDHHCPKCGMVLSSKHALTRHIKEVHSANKVFPCSECKETFTRERSLQQHVLTDHRGNYPTSERFDSLLLNDSTGWIQHKTYILYCY